jgi:hypothetical protein
MNSIEGEIPGARIVGEGVLDDAEGRSRCCGKRDSDLLDDIEGEGGSYTGGGTNDACLCPELPASKAVCNAEENLS